MTKSFFALTYALPFAPIQVRVVQHKQTKDLYALKYINKARCVKQKAVSNIVQERKLLEEVRCRARKFSARAAVTFDFGSLPASSHLYRSITLSSSTCAMPSKTTRIAFSCLTSCSEATSGVSARAT